MSDQLEILAQRALSEVYRRTAREMLTGHGDAARGATLLATRLAADFPLELLASTLPQLVRISRLPNHPEIVAQFHQAMVEGAADCERRANELEEGWR